MTFPFAYMYRLVDRGGAGLTCDERGVALGGAPLARVHPEAGGRRRCEVRSEQGVSQILKAAYGPQPDAVVQRLHRGLRRTARWLEAGDLCHAGIEAVTLGFPDLTGDAMAKLAEIADLEKGGAAWEDEPRVPPGRRGGGQWTTGGGGAPATAKPDRPFTSAAKPVPTYSPGATAAPSAGSGVMLDDGVYRPGRDRPRLVPTAVLQVEDEPPFSTRRTGKPEEEPFGSFGPPTEVGDIRELFSNLEHNPSETAPWDPGPEALDYAALADDVGPVGAAEIFHNLQAETKRIDPTYNDVSLLPEGGVAGMPEAARHRLIDDALLDRAAAEYRVRRRDLKMLQGIFRDKI